MADIERQRADATSHGERVIMLSREFDAPPADVFRAWTDPKLWAQWFAPQPMTVPRVETDPRPGGRYTFVMRDEEGNDYTSTGEYLEVEEPWRIVYRDSVQEMPASFLDMVNQARGMEPGTPIPDGIATVTFEDIGGKTRMTFSEEFDSKATRDAWVQTQMVEGFSEGLDNLERLLQRQPATM